MYFLQVSGNIVNHNARIFYTYFIGVNRIYIVLIHILIIPFPLNELSGLRLNIKS